MLGSAALRAVGHGLLIAAAGMGLAAMLGSAAVGIGSVAVAGVLGMGCMMGADALRDTAILADAERKRHAEEEQYREDDAVLAFAPEMPALYAAEAAERQASMHVERLNRQRARQGRSAGKGV